MAARLPVEFDDVQAAARCLVGKIRRTPLLTNQELDAVSGGRVFVKPECMQLTGSFKIRGAYNRLSQLSTAERKRGVVAWSSGNHAQGVALAARLVGTRATIVMPADAPATKIAGTRALGAEIVFYDRRSESREDIGLALAEKSGATVVPAYDDPQIIAGQGTSALEAMEDMRVLDIQPDVYVVCCGGGGLLAGSSLAIHGLSPDTQIYSAEPQHYDDHARSFVSGRRERVAADAPASICDALLAPEPGEITFAVNRNHVAGGLVVSDDEVKKAMAFAMTNLKLVVEPGGAVALAAVLSGRLETANRTLALILSGGNVDRELYCTSIGAAG